MKDFFELVKWLLERDIRARNAASFLAALVSVVVFYFVSRDSNWFEHIEEHGMTALGVAYLIVFLVAFFSISLAYSITSGIRQATIRHKIVRENLESLTDWQRQFLLRFIVERRTQIPKFEVGRFKAAWDFEMAMLVKKRIVKEHRRAGVFEIEPIYRQYLIEHWDSESDTLKWSR